MLRQIAPAHILHLADVGLQDKILGVGGELPELFQSGQAISRLLDSGQEVTVLRGKSGKNLGRCLQFACVTACREQRFQILHEIRFGFAQRHHPFLKWVKEKQETRKGFLLGAATGGCYFVVVCSLSLQVLQRSGIVGKNCAHRLATF